eukprot:6213022-Pleurochrysis_carterae.AAC.2
MVRQKRRARARRRGLGRGRVYARFLSPLPMCRRVRSKKERRCIYVAACVLTIASRGCGSQSSSQVYAGAAARLF